MPKAVWFVWVLALFALGSARAALQFDVMPGFEGKIHEAAWFPVTCEIYNDGPGFNAIIEISAGQFANEQVRQVPVELPTSTRKRIVIPMFSSSASRYGSKETWTGRLLDSNGKPIRGIDPRVNTTKALPLEAVLMGALPRNFGGSPTFPDMKNGQSDLAPEVARITVDQFPDNPLTLEALNAFYLNSEKAPDLKANQVTALLAWVRAGGHLVVSVEQITDLKGTGWLQQFAPMDLTDSKVLRIDQEVIAWLGGQTRPEPRPTRRGRPVAPNMGSTSGTYSDMPADSGFDHAQLPVATGNLKDGTVLLAAENVPLAIQAPRGRGKITLLTFSPEREPFRSWKARSYFWAKIAGIPGDYFSSAGNAGWGGVSTDGIFGALIDSRQIKKLPVTWLLLLLVVYLVVIGPFDQWWLKKIGKQMLTWITFPAYVVLFSLLIYFIGYKLRAGETEWNELNIVDVLPRGDKVDLHGRTYVSIYSSGNATYPLNGQAGHAALRPELADFRGAPKNDRLKVVQQGNSFKAEVFVPVWTSLLYASEWFKTNDTPFLASVTKSGSGYQLEIENLLERPLEHVRVIAGELIYDVASIPASAHKVIPLDPANGTDLRQFVRSNGSFFQSAVDMRRNPLGDTSGGRLENRPLTAVTASLLSFLEGTPGQGFISPPGLDVGPQVARGDAVVFAWLPKFSLTEKLNNFQPPRFQQDTLLRLTVPIH